MSDQEFPIRWQPDVCDCSIRQCRVDPDNKFYFEKKCNLHTGLTDSVARADIIRMCIEKSEALQNQ